MAEQPVEHADRAAELAAQLAAQLADLSEEFRRSVPERVGEIEAALAVVAESWDGAALVALREAAHRLAGAAGTFGQPDLGAQALQIEELAQRLRANPAERGASASQKLKGLLSGLVVTTAGAATPTVADATMAEVAVVLPDAPRRRSIFVVDDDRQLGKEVVEKLDQYGYEAQLFETPAEIIAALRERRPDALVFDLPFPGGVLDEALLAEARRLAPVPVLIVSERGDIEARLHALRGGCDAYLTKPLDIGVLVDRLDDLVDKIDHQQARVLIVEDDETTGSALLAVLASSGMVAELVSRPEELLARMQEMLPDLVLMDMYLPGCRGDELVAILRQIGTWQGVPIIYLSVEADRDRQLLALEHGGDDFLQKPIAPEHLLRVVGARIERGRRLRSLMTRDSLTGLLNHARFMEQLEIEVMRAQRAGKPLSVAMIDIDEFKTVNDQHGHAVGDIVIKSLARLLQQRLRQVDVIGRYGGEEFAVVFPETPSLAARAVLEEIRRLFADLCFHRPDGDFRVSFSAGVASLDGCGAARLLIEAADRALYEAKRLGRNRVDVAVTLSGGAA